MKNQKYIVHLDMDAFFAAVEQRDDPSLVGKPVVIGADPKKGTGRGVVSTCSYEARKFGIHSAMPISQAYRVCPHAVFLPPNMKKYAQVSQQIMAILSDFTPDIEPISIDEAFLDISGSYQLFAKTPYETCKIMKQRIKDELGLIASIGIAPVKMVAKIASDLRKPDAIVEVLEGKVQEFLFPLPVKRLWGLGRKTEEALVNMNIHTIGDIARMSSEHITKLLGNNGLHLWYLAQGIDPRGVETTREVKSISNEYTFEEDTSDHHTIEQSLLFLSEKVSRRLRQDNLKGKTVTLKIRLQGFHTYTRAKTLPESTNHVDTIWHTIQALYSKFMGASNNMIRLVGVKVSQLASSDTQESLFQSSEVVKQEHLHQAIDKIQNKFGKNCIHRARLTSKCRGE